jgi:hypothetical protein
MTTQTKYSWAEVKASTNGKVFRTITESTNTIGMGRFFNLGGRPNNTVVFFGAASNGLEFSTVSEHLWERYTYVESPEVIEMDFKAMPAPIAVKLNDKYSAQVSHKGIHVGCQVISFEALDELTIAANQIRSK